MNFSRVGKVVKQAFCFSIQVEYQAERSRKATTSWGVWEASKVKESRHVQNSGICPAYCINDSNINIF